MATLTRPRALFHWSCAIVLWAAFSAAGDTSAADPNPTSLPLGRVVLFTSGVGFFEHAGKVDGNARVDLKFNVADINDLLKSMVLEDQGGGQISTITYDSRDPISKTLRTFSIDLTSEPTLADLLRQIRGEQVRVSTTGAGLWAGVTGQILGVERRQRYVGKEEVEPYDVVNLLTATGLKSIPVDTFVEFQLLNKKLDAELKEALGILALAQGRDKKSVSLKFLGAGERPVRVGYVQEAPLWKTSYRLVLKKDGASWLQGWAIVENTTENDWQDVALTLVSGRPVSYRMDLYQPLYVLRPEVAPETFAALRPQVHKQDLASKEEQFQRARQLPGQGMGMGGMAGMGGMMGGRRGGAGGAQGGMAKGATFSSEENETARPTPIDLAAGVRSAAQAEDVGELFRYQIKEPVTVLRQQSAMLPIVNDSVRAEKVSLYNPAVHAVHPLNAAQLVNTTSLHLMQGPITVFDGGEYAGDARIEELSPGARRLISYALDLDVEVVQKANAAPQEMVSVKIAAGTMEIKKRERRTNQYTAKNSGTRGKKILIEQPVDAAWKLTTKAAEDTRSLYRFALTAEPGKPASLSVEEERTVPEHIALSSFSEPEHVAAYLKSSVVSQAMKDALQQVIAKQQELSDLGQQRKELEHELSEIEAEQGRIRLNMTQLDRTSDIYRRYIQKFNDQESQIEKLRVREERVRAEEATARLALQNYLEKLNLD